jgi:hypothetical protein
VAAAHGPLDHLGVLRRHGMSRLAATDRISGVVVRDQRERLRRWSTSTSRSWGASPTVAATAALFLIEAAALFADHGVHIQRGPDRQRQGLRRGRRLRRDRRRAGHRAQADPPLPAPDQRQGGAVPQDPAGGGAYARLYRSNAERRRALTRWLRFDNYRRPPTSLDGLTLMAVLVNSVHGKDI